MTLYFQVISLKVCQLSPGWHLGSNEPVSFHTTIEKETQNNVEQGTVEQQKNHIILRKIWSNEQGKKLSRINI